MTQNRFAIRVIIILLYVFGYSSISAQSFNWGVEFGGNVTHSREMSRSGIGYNVGGFGEILLGKGWFVDGALRLTSQPFADYQKYKSGGTPPVVNGEQLNITLEEDCKYNPKYLTLPLRGGYKFDIKGKCKLSISAGPVVGFGLWGGGEEKYAMYNNDDLMGDIDVVTFKNLFHEKEGPISRLSSRWEYGANVRLGCEFAEHWRVGAEFSNLFIPGGLVIVSDYNISTLTIGYSF